MSTTNAQWSQFDQHTRTSMRSAREALGVTQGEMAVHAGISKSYMRHIEAGRCLPSTAVIVRIAKYLGMKPVELFEELNAK